MSFKNIIDTGKKWNSMYDHCARSAPNIMVGCGSSNYDHEDRYKVDLKVRYHNVCNRGNRNIVKRRLFYNDKNQQQYYNCEQLTVTHSELYSCYGYRCNNRVYKNGSFRFGTRYIFNNNLAYDLTPEYKINNNKSFAGLKKYKTRFFYNKNFVSSAAHNDLKLRKCSDKRCKVCLCVGKEYDGNENENYPKVCKVYNCIYKLRCKTCDKSYIGQTSDKMNVRFNNHKSDIRHCKTGKQEQEIEISHFNIHGIDNIELSILNIVPNKRDRLIYEEDMMIKHGTVYPYGLNVMFNGHNVLKTFRNSVMDASIYEQIKHNAGIKINGIGRKALLNFKSTSEIEKAILDCKNNSIVGDIKFIVFNVKKSIVPELINLLYLKKGYCNIDLALDLLRFRVCSQKLEKYLQIKSKGENRENKLYFVMDYIEHGIKGLNFKRILNKYNDILPVKNIKIVNAFKYEKPVGRLLFNYNSFAKELKKGIEGSTCCCTDEKYENFINHSHGHVLTGNLDIVSNLNLRKIMAYGTKYRLKRLVTKTHAMKRITININTFIKKLSYRYSLPESVFKEWRFEILKEFRNIYISKCEGVAGDCYNDLRNSIKELQKLFIITYVDKASTNYAIICKQLYGQLLRESYGNINNYKLLNSSRQVIGNRIRAFHKKLNYIQQSNELPYLVLVPKFHKNPVSFRTITCGFGSYLELANKIFLDILNEIFVIALKSTPTYIIKNSFELITKLKKSSNIVEVHTYDFEDLYNSIDLEDLQIILLDFFTRFNNTALTIDKFINLFNFVVRENYLYEGKNVYKQIKGIPMGGSCSSILADIYLFMYEQNSTLSLDFMCFRYIDDVLIVKINDSVDTYNFNHYPYSLNLKKASTNFKNVDYLDININIENNSLVTSVYDKRNDFGFDTNKLLHFSSNVHTSVFRNIFINGLSRIEKLSSDSKLIIRDLIKFYKLAVTQGYPTHFLDYLTNIYTRNKEYRFKLFSMLDGGVNSQVGENCCDVDM